MSKIGGGPAPSDLGRFVAFARPAIERCQIDCQNIARLDIDNCQIECQNTARLELRWWVMAFIHGLRTWPRFKWDTEKISAPVANVCRRQGVLIGRMSAYGFNTQQEVMLKALTEETVKSSAIEGEVLNPEAVRSSIARRLRLHVAGVSQKEDRHVDRIVAMMIDATSHYDRPLYDERLFQWHADLFPGIRSSTDTFRVGAWRDDKEGPMQVISGVMGQEKVHYEAPAAEKVPQEMKTFLAWFNKKTQDEWVLRAGIAHLWFVTIHPFGDGNGRITRAITEMALARSDKNSQRFYSMSSQILEERTTYYQILEATQRGSLEITGWLSWFLECLGRAITKAETLTEGALEQEKFWRSIATRGITINERQRKMLRKMLVGFRGTVTTSKWADITDCAQRTAYADIEALIKAGVLKENAAGGRSTSYSLAGVA
jgi:Fic family protein